VNSDYRRKNTVNYLVKPQRSVRNLKKIRMSSEASIRTAAITGAKPIPANGSLQFGFSDLSSTPNGTLYSTTPGGTKIVYDRNTMMLIGKNSPMSHTPPSGMAIIPGVTMVAAGEVKPGKHIKIIPQTTSGPIINNTNNNTTHQSPDEHVSEEHPKEEMFQMDD